MSRRQNLEALSSQTEEMAINADDRFEELSSSSSSSLHEAAVITEAWSTDPPHPSVPSLYTSLPPLHDPLVTASSKLQEQTVEECLPYLKGESGQGEVNSYGIPRLRRKKHIDFAKAGLEELPDYFVMLDASRPWIVYWAMASLSWLTC